MTRRRKLPGVPQAGVKPVAALRTPSALRPSDVLSVVEGLREAAKAIQTIASERTKQQEIRARSVEEVTRIRAMRDVLIQYLDKSFDERRANFARLFDVVDEALAAGDNASLAQGLEAVVKLADSSPFKALADVAAARAALGEKGKEWEL